jgi:hypothetical protein
MKLIGRISTNSWETAKKKEPQRFGGGSFAV